MTSSTPLFIGGIRVVYHADGIDDKSVVFTETAHPGPHTASVDATSAATKSHCNLNDHFDEDPGMGLTGWFTDRELTAAYGGSELSAGDELHLYARNRCTLHIEYAKGSLEPEEDAVYVSEPKDDAATAQGALELPDFTGLAESHSSMGSNFPPSAITAPVTWPYTTASASRSRHLLTPTARWKTAPGGISCATPT